MLDYILRHTWGFKKTADKISLTQFEKGIITKTGEILDKGTGLTRPTIVEAIKGLEEKRFIKVSREGINEYELVKNFNYPLVKEFNYPSKESLPQPSKNSLHTISDSAIKDITIEKSFKNLNGEEVKIKEKTEEERKQDVSVLKELRQKHFPTLEEKNLILK